MAVVLHGSQLVLNHPWLALLALFHRHIDLVINYRLRSCGLAVLDSISILICRVYVNLLRSFLSCGSRSGGTLFPHGLAYGDMVV